MASSSRKRSQNGSSAGAKSQSKQQGTSKANKGSSSFSKDSCGPSEFALGPHRGILWTLGRLLTIFIKGFAALVLFAIMFNLAVVLLNKAVFDGKLQQYIPTKSWRDILGQ